MFLFIDGIGLAPANPKSNPFTNAKTPFLDEIIGRNGFLLQNYNVNTELATIFSLDACLGIEGLPQSATGQAAILTGNNIPAQIGYHYGPKPNTEITDLIQQNNLFKTLKMAGKKATLINAYPPSYFENIKNGRRIYSVIPLAAITAGLNLYNKEDLVQKQALSADFTNQGWRTILGFNEVPPLSPLEAGKLLATLSNKFDFTFFEYWATDIAGHHQDMDQAITLIETLDQALEGLCSRWDFDEGFILITSDHGNMEDLSHRHHTYNPVPFIILGNANYRKNIPTFSSLLDVYPTILRILKIG
ncbi:MAG: hypothetical protein ACPL1K_02565 [Candidatus Kryptoniota bacterium]